MDTEKVHGAGTRQNRLDIFPRLDEGGEGGGVEGMGREAGAGATSGCTERDGIEKRITVSQHLALIYRLFFSLRQQMKAVVGEEGPGNDEAARERAVGSMPDAPNDVLADPTNDVQRHDGDEAEREGRGSQEQTIEERSANFKVK